MLSLGRLVQRACAAAGSAPGAVRGCGQSPAGGALAYGAGALASQAILARWYCQGKSVEARVDAINQLFAEARDEIEGAREDAGTTYFNESAKMAKDAVEDTLGKWDELLATLDDEARMRMQRGMGLKMEQLKAELSELDHLHDDH